MAEVQVQDKGDKGGKVRSKKTIYKGRYDADGGFGIPIDYILYVYHYFHQTKHYEFGTSCKAKTRARGANSRN